MLLQAALNGPFGKDHHPKLPVSAAELARDGAACVAAGAQAIHLHPRDADGAERLDAQVVDAVVAAVRDACGVPVGVSTGAWIEPDLGRRLELIGGLERAGLRLGQPLRGRRGDDACGRCSTPASASRPACGRSRTPSASPPAGWATG